MKYRIRLLTGLVIAAIFVQAASAQGIPRMQDGKPSFDGVWAGPGFTHKGANDTDTPSVSVFDSKNFSPFKPGGETFMNRKESGDATKDDPTAFCLPNGLTRQILSPYAQQWIQTPTRMTVLYEYMHFFRTIPIGAPNRPHDKNIETTWMGDSIGWWEGDTFVIDSIGLKEWMMDASYDMTGVGHWHSDQAHVVERLKYIGPGLVSYAITLDDPKIFTAPWSQEFQMKLHPTWKLYENVCEENNRCIGGKCTRSDVQQ
jgi:hypothetical protein